MKLINDLMVLEWDSEKKERNKYVYPRGAPDHLPDALQYAYNLCFHHAHDFQLNTWVAPGSAEYYQREEELMLKQQESEVDEGEGGPWAILEDSFVC